MNKARLFTTIAGLTSLLAFESAALSQEAETAIGGRLTVSENCLFSNIDQVATERPQVQEGIAGLLVPIFAAFAGDLAKSAVAGVAGAIEEASQKHAYTATGTSGFLAGSIDRADGAVALPWQFKPGRKCLMFHVPATNSRNVDLVEAFLDDAQSYGVIDEAKKNSLIGSGLGLAGISGNGPDVYVELALVPTKGAYYVRPLLVWYRRPLSSAGTRSKSVEMVVKLSTPAFSEQAGSDGTAFAVARMQLPKMIPSQRPMTFADLAGLGAYYIPGRPTEGVVDTTVNAYNSTETAVVTAKTLVKTKQRAELAARALLSETNNSANRAAFIVARDAHIDAVAGQAVAENRRSLLAGGLHGPTNASVSFVVIRDANKFGLAIAAALDARKEEVGTAIETAIKGSPQWEELDTTYLTKMLEVQTKEAEFKAAEATEDAGAILTARNNLLIAKANANQAAVAAGKDIPYPDIFMEAGT